MHTPASSTFVNCLTLMMHDVRPAGNSIASVHLFHQILLSIAQAVFPWRQTRTHLNAQSHRSP